MIYSREQEQRIKNAFRGLLYENDTGNQVGTNSFNIKLVDNNGNETTIIAKNLVLVNSGASVGLESTVMFAVPQGFTVNIVRFSLTGFSGTWYDVILDANEIVTFDKNGTYLINSCNFNFTFN